MMMGSNLPDDIDTLKAMILPPQAEIAQRDALVADRDAVIERKEDCIQRLEKLVADFKRALFGALSEKASPFKNVKNCFLYTLIKIGLVRK